MTDSDPDVEAAEQVWLFFQNPAQVAKIFFDCLLDPTYDGRLDVFVTPESVSGWGDFSEVRGVLQSVENPGVASIGNRAVGAEEAVAYIGVVRDVVETYKVEHETVIPMAGVFTVVFHREADRWLVHSFGDYVRPEQIHYL